MISHAATPESIAACFSVMAELRPHLCEDEFVAVVQAMQQLAINEGCNAFHLDSGTQRHDAHRFYLRHGFHISYYHFMQTFK